MKTSADPDGSAEVLGRIIPYIPDYQQFCNCWPFESKAKEETTDKCSSVCAAIRSGHMNQVAAAFAIIAFT